MSTRGSEHAASGAPVLSCVHKGVPGIFMDVHMMVSDPERWVDDIADAGGSLYCFHIEAARKSVQSTPPSPQDRCIFGSGGPTRPKA